MSLLMDFLSLVYPNICQVCGKSLFKHEYILCMKCRHHLPYARFSGDPRNPAAQVFWGRIPAKMVITGFLYNKGNAIQQLIHKFKYRGLKDVGLFLGEELGNEIIKCPGHEDISMIIPVPLHPRKQKKRGFNQSEIIARGIASKINADVQPSVLYRKSFSGTQTRKSKYERWENVESIFAIKNYDLIKNKHILLVDDVITTGATIEACAQVLLRVEGVSVSVVAVAFTRL
jgi:competence protein ComFC